MSYHYSNSDRENEPTALPDVEVLYINETFFDDGEFPYPPGWYWWTCFPGCIPSSEPIGPFNTEENALENARE